MTAFHPALADLPAEFPIFPLGGALLLPRGRLPLNIFEPRYLAMVEDSLAAGRMFGMVQPDPRLPRGPQGPGTYRTGCLGRLTSFSETEDGRFLITLTGVIRFSIVEETGGARGYRRVRGAFAGYAADLDDAEGPDLDRARLIAALKRYFQATGVDANWETINAMADAPLLVTLGMACPFTPEEKQALLEAPTQAERARALLALLEINAFSADPDQDPKAV